MRFAKFEALKLLFVFILQFQPHEIGQDERLQCASQFEILKYEKKSFN